MGCQPPCVVDLALGNHQPHGHQDKGKGDDPLNPGASCARHKVLGRLWLIPQSDVVAQLRVAGSLREQLQIKEVGNGPTTE